MHLHKHQFTSWWTLTILIALSLALIIFLKVELIGEMIVQAPLDTMPERVVGNYWTDWCNAFKCS